MTNAEKFKEVFGFEPDTNTMIYGNCPDKSKDCIYYNYVEGCRCQDWWNEEFKEETKCMNKTLKKEAMESNFERSVTSDIWRALGNLHRINKEGENK